MFRLDINGLRFIAVAMVVLFHFKIGYFYGGYAGVDVFFVISGFLMNEICKEKVGTKGWVSNFYKKRFKRIYPALVACVLFSFILAITSTPPSMLRSLFLQVISSLSFTSNLYYLKATSGYFTDAADSFIFLHTWSLSVEWQFYLIFPLILIVSNALSKKAPQYVIYFSLILTSFIFCVLLMKYSQMYSFYLLPSRAWELIIGAMASSITFKNRYPRITEVISLVTLMLFTGIVKESYSWPGFTTLIPTIATALLLHANIGNNKTLLKAKPFQLIGSASYSIYLFHWPVVSLFYLNNIEFSLFNQFAGILISLVLGFLSYFFIEKRAQLAILKLAFCAIFISFVAFLCNKLNASKLWLPNSVLAMDEFHSYAGSKEGIEQFGNQGRICFLTSGYNSASQFTENSCLAKKADSSVQRLLLVGDSHAAEYYKASTELYKDFLVMQVTSSGCMPFVNNTYGEKRCTDLMERLYKQYIKEYKIDTVIISANWIDGEKYFSHSQIANNIENTVAFFKQYARDVVVLGQTKNYDTAFYRIAQSNDFNEIDKHALKPPKNLNNYLVAFMERKKINYINLYDLDCDDKKNCSYISPEGYPMMFDNNHFTYPWTKIMLSKVRYQNNQSTHE
ncbi:MULTISPECIES: acyltransferase family protein [Klebsiella]|uniref:acyltransferase family protein n=1 Tax=Klebsiella TaxID=570 RepID=UPI000F4D6002|nr:MULTISPECIES: acyltransferase family protein [Klebsiella]AYZ19807.1 acyltransferase [Klebsiella sp. FDAARGOS_511]MDV1908748.1 acyltransferase family protein [Klebsiella pasteurii]MDV1914527.1 acyltransferase family protein [Klebsiella pasteurii]QQO29813.1 acyltransferase [Klebsiella michiganensis]